MADTVVTRFSKPRFALIALVVCYPLITALLYLVAPMTAAWPVWQRTLIVTPAMVGMMVWVVMPAVQRSFGKFINPVVSDRRGDRVRTPGV